MPQTLVIDRNFRDVGRIRIRTGTTKPAVRTKMSDMLTELRENGRLDVLRAIRDRKVGIMAVYSAYRQRSLDALPIGAASANLSQAMRAWIEKLEVPRDVSAKHKESLETSRRYFDREDAKATIADLPDVLDRLRQTLGAKHPRSFNLARSAALTFARATLKKTHAVYLACQAVDRRKGEPRKKGKALSVALIRRYFPNPDSDHIDGCAWSMVTTGMGAGEYWGRWSVRPDRVHIDGTKRKGRVRDVPLVRMPTVPTIHRRTFEDALRERTGRAIVPYDLRRTYVHWLELAGVPRTRRRLYMGHGAGDVTELYERHDVDEFLAADAVRLKDLIETTSTANEPADEPRRRSANWVYFIQNVETQQIKVGIAKDPLGRLRELQVANAHQLTLLGVLRGGRPEERAIHTRFKSLHVRGEWFRGKPELVSWISQALRSEKIARQTSPNSPTVTENPT
jgi:hypothetical protein